MTETPRLGCLTAHAAVSDAAVIGVPDEITGEGVVAFVMLKPGAALTDVSGDLAAHHPRGCGVAQDTKRESGAPVDPPGLSGRGFGGRVDGGEPAALASIQSSVDTVRKNTCATPKYAP
jgi:hypothetical protein